MKVIVKSINGPAREYDVESYTKVCTDTSFCGIPLARALYVWCCFQAASLPCSPSTVIQLQVEDFKKTIEKQQEYPSERQTLIFDGKVMLWRMLCMQSGTE